MGTPLCWEQQKPLWAKSWPVKVSGRNPIPFDGATSQVSLTVRDSPSLETSLLTTLVLWELSHEISPAKHTWGECSKRFLSIGLKHKQTEPKDVAHATAQVPLSLFWNSSH